MANKTKKSENDNSNGNGFPVELTKSYIRAQILASFDYAAEALCSIANHQTRAEKNYEKTGTPSVERNGVGFMSSHAVRGQALATLIESGEKLTGEQKAEIQQMAGRYTRQLAQIARENAPAAVKKKLAPFFNTEKLEKPAPKARTPRKTKTTRKNAKPATAERRTRRSKKETQAA